MELQSLDGVFERRVLRIPDYQRGYAWQEHQIKDFWDDILRLDVNKIHYTGVLTLEPVKDTSGDSWGQDEWLIGGMGYRPFYVVDGQQRLTTAIILIQAITERIDAHNKDLPESQKASLAHQTIEEIKSKYVVQKAAGGRQRSYLFGYEKDNPSDEFLRTIIFGESSTTDAKLRTLYTRNLCAAKDFFAQELKKMEVEDIETLFKKLTQRIKFNLYVIDDEIDVFVAFETMNNRGKSLTNLELLKNRLIYLSARFEAHEALRKDINSVWKTIYEYLGKNADQPLDDNDFLYNHWIMYFGGRKKGDVYRTFLLDEEFITQNASLTAAKVGAYIESLQDSVRHWFYMHNPYWPLPEYKDDENKKLIDRLLRLSFGAFKPLLLASYVSGQKIEERNKLLIAAERYRFSLFTLSRRRADNGDSEIFGYARDLLEGNKTIPNIIKKINERIDRYYDTDAFLMHIAENYKIDGKGFYGWGGLRYFLYEYEQKLQLMGKMETEQFSWHALMRHQKDHVSVEHILPQKPSDPYWRNLFNKYSSTKKKYLAHSLGNLLPLSVARNSSFQNDSFALKKDNGRGVGYRYGSLSENEVAMNEDWDASRILERGLDLLKFMEERWNIKLGDDEAKRKLLHLDFLTDESNG